MAVEPLLATRAQRAFMFTSKHIIIYMNASDAYTLSSIPPSVYFISFVLGAHHERWLVL